VFVVILKKIGFLEENYYNVFIIKMAASLVYWSEFLATDPEVPDSIPCATIFSEKCWV
jgi:hypothetical protein